MMLDTADSRKTLVALKWLNKKLFGTDHAQYLIMSPDAMKWFCDNWKDGPTLLQQVLEAKKCLGLPIQLVPGNGIFRVERIQQNENQREEQA